MIGKVQAATGRVVNGIEAASTLSATTTPVGNIPNGYNRTCPLPRLLVQQQAQVPVGQQEPQSGPFPTEKHRSLSLSYTTNQAIASLFCLKHR